MLTTMQPTTAADAITVSRAALLALLDRAKHIVPARFPKPILTCVHLEASDGFLRLRATDGDLALCTQMPVDGQLPACVVPLAELVRRLKASKHAACTLAVHQEQLRINGGHVEHEVQLQQVLDYPPVAETPAGSAVHMDAAELVAGLHIAGLAVANETSRYAINGILVESDRKGTRLVGTDGRRLVSIELPGVTGTFTGAVILPARFAQLIGKLTDKHTDQVVLSVARQKSDKGEEVPGSLFAAGTNWLLSTYEPEGRFPHYRDVVPGSHSRFVMDREDFVSLLAEVALATSDDWRMVSIDLTDTHVRLSAAVPGVGTASAVLPCRFSGGGDAVIHTAFNPPYLLVAVKSLRGDQLVIDVEQNGFGCDHKVYGKPALLYTEEGPGTHWVVMPVNAGLPATRENLGSNFKPEMADGE